jgi:hypothetical protein
MPHATFLRLAAELLDLASDTFGNHGCNDFKMADRFTEEERIVLADMMNRQNLGPDYKTEYAPDDDDLMTADRLKDWAMDFCLMDAMALMLREMADHADSNAVAPKPPTAHAPVDGSAREDH